MQSSSIRFFVEMFSNQVSVAGTECVSKTYNARAH